MKNNLLTKTEVLELRKKHLEDYQRDISKYHIHGETWDIWRNIIDASILVEEINIEIAKERINGLKDSLEVYKDQ